MSAKVETTAYAGEVPWHGLGVKVSNDLTPAQMMESAGLDWRVRELSTYVDFSKDGAKKRVPTGQKALIRETDGRVLTTVGKNWIPVQNEEAFEFFDDFVSAGDMEMHTAGSLRDGKIIWALAKVKESFELFGGDKVESYMLFHNPHEYGKTVGVEFTPIRVVCNNTLTLSMSLNNKRVTFNHRKAFDPEEAKMALGIAHEKLETYKETAAFLGSKSYKDETITEYFKRVFGETSDGEPNRNAKKALEVVETQPGAEYASGTWWSALNAVTFMTDHTLGRSADNRLSSAWFGANQRKKIDAVKSAVEFAEAA